MKVLRGFGWSAGGHFSLNSVNCDQKFGYGRLDQVFGFCQIEQSRERFGRVTASRKFRRFQIFENSEWFATFELSCHMAALTPEEHPEERRIRRLFEAAARNQRHIGRDREFVAVIDAADVVQASVVPEHSELPEPALDGLVLAPATPADIRKRRNERRRRKHRADKENASPNAPEVRERERARKRTARDALTPEQRKELNKLRRKHRRDGTGGQNGAETVVVAPDAVAGIVRAPPAKRVCPAEPVDAEVYWRSLDHELGPLHEQEFAKANMAEFDDFQRRLAMVRCSSCPTETLMDRRECAAIFICETCRSLKKRKLFTKENEMDPGDQPPELSGLSAVRVWPCLDLSWWFGLRHVFAIVTCV